MNASAELATGTPVRSGFAPTDDGFQLYWRAVGSGPPLICCNGVGVSTFFFKYILAHFSDRYTVVVWDYRGHGRSTSPDDPNAVDLSMERCAKDIHQIREHIGLTEPAVLTGHSMGCQVILQHCKDYPDDTRALIPMLGTFARPLDTFMDSPYSLPIFRVIKRLADLGGKNGTRALLPLYANPLAFRVGGLTGLVDRHYATPEDIGKYMEHLVHMDPRVFLRMVEVIADHDLSAFLPDVHVPTLVVAAENDVFTPLHRSRIMAQRIPDAELIVLAEGSHAAIVEHPETINLRIDRFLRERL